jgi:hypothetical protein
MHVGLFSYSGIRADLELRRPDPDGAQAETVSLTYLMVLIDPPGLKGMPLAALTTSGAALSPTR